MITGDLHQPYQVWKHGGVFVQETITADEFLNMEFGNPDEMPNEVEDREAEPVREIAVANEETENDQEVEPVSNRSGERKYGKIPQSGAG